jgi:putative flippase GtrA
MAEPSLNHVRVMQQFLRYVVAGGAAFVLDFATLAFVVEHLGLHYLVGATLGFVVGSAACYALSVAWVFDERRFSNRVHEAVAFVAIGIAALGVNNATMWTLVEGLGASYAWAKICAAAIVMVFNFALRRAAVFSRDSLALPSGEPLAQGARAK